ncbi:hypothetical protein EOM82_03790 [bacterium]|nr:hypothetical protein [bacterium]
MAIARMRTVSEIIEAIKKEDPDNAITANFIRKLCKQNQIKYMSTGKKLLIDYDSFLSLISCGNGGF